MADSSVFPMDDQGIVLNEEKALNELSDDHSTDDIPRATEFEVMECPICLQICVHPSKLPCGHIFCFLCVKGLKNRRCAMCRTEFPLEFLERPQLLLPINASASTSHSEQNEYQWFYKGRNGWWQYDERTCQEIEEAYKNGQKQCTILVAGYVYVVDFDQMLQQRQTDPLRKRQVKRDLATIPKKGVAGLRLWCTDDSTQNGDGAESTNSNLIATIAATDAAIRIASDIIDSTLAHADDHNEQRDDANGQPIINSADGSSILNDANDLEQDDLNDGAQLSSSSSSNSSNFNSSYNRRDMLDEIEETFNITNLSSINNSFRSTSHQLDDFFSVTLDEFRNLTMNNIADDSSSDENNDEDDSTVHFNENNSNPKALRR